MVHHCVWNLLRNLIGLVRWNEALTSKLDTTLIGAFSMCARLIHSEGVVYQKGGEEATRPIF